MMSILPSQEELISANDSVYKSYHESFMQNNNGSSAFHSFMFILFAIQCTVVSSTYKTSNLNSLKYVIEFIILVVPLCITYLILYDFVYIINLMVFFILIYRCFLLKNEISLSKFNKINSFKYSRLISVSCLRGLTYLITNFCILAVDFKMFPRYLAKTETYGYSLMDSGVGLFVLMSGITHKDVNRGNVLSVFRSNIKFVTVLFILGLSRILTIKHLDYQEHVTEYGVHWNFFFTLAVCKLCSCILLCFYNHPLILFFIATCTHELCLYFSLEKWVFSNKLRLNLLDANREGLSSSLGYVSLYLFGVYIKSILSDKIILRKYTLQKLLGLCVLLWILTYAIQYFRPASRVLANAGYCLYVDSIVVSILLFIYFFEVLFENSNFVYKTPMILSATNDNGLICFLMCNLMTGFVNLSIRTLTVSLISTVCILLSYMALSIVLVIYLKKIGFKI